MSNELFFREATKEDIQLILEFIKELASYVNLVDSVKATNGEFL